jgi:hypothetical protein
MKRQFTLEYWRDDGWYVDVFGKYQAYSARASLFGSGDEYSRGIPAGVGRFELPLPAGVQRKEIGVEVEAP